MIRRPAESDWLLVSQVEHARLAARLAAMWQRGDLVARDALLRAIALHDDGWYEWEAAPDVSAAGPRHFTEMPMDVAAGIWSRSIAISGLGEPSRAAASRLVSTGTPASASRLAVLDAVLATNGDRFSADRVPVEGVTDDEGHDALDWLAEVGVLRRHDATPLDGGRRFSLAVARAPAPLEGTWVSRHFARLADEARRNRSDPADVAAAERFLAEQQQRRDAWWPAIEIHAGDDAERLAEGGYRLLRFFDWLSLWLCCDVRREAAEFTVPGGVTIEFEPSGPEEFVVDPWPFEQVGPITFEATALRVPRDACTTSDDLRTALANARVQRLSWSLRRR